MIRELVLHTETGVQLFLFRLFKHPEDAYIEADAVLALESYPEHTTFRVPSGDRVVHIENLDPLFAGFYAHPGDPKHFGRLKRPALFIQTGVTDG